MRATDSWLARSSSTTSTVAWLIGHLLRPATSRQTSGAPSLLRDGRTFRAQLSSPADLPLAGSDDAPQLHRNAPRRAGTPERFGCAWLLPSLLGLGGRAAHAGEV